MGFIFKGARLEPGRMVAEYAIPNLATLQVMLRLRGGMLQDTSGREDYKELQVKLCAWACSCVCLHYIYIYISIYIYMYIYIYIYI